jgi:hypothetical protein
MENSANGEGIKKALIARDFIDVDGGIVSFNDLSSNCESS